MSRAPEDQEWDEFLATTPGGHHVQTSLWAQVKAPLGWRAARVVVKRGREIVAGAQILLRSLPFVGAVGYVPRGPVCAVDDPTLAQRVIDEVRQIGRSYRLRYLVVQPPCNGTRLVRQLPRWGFQPSRIELAPTATVLIDLRADPDALLAGMKSRARYNLRRGLRNGITIRYGTEKDLTTFYRLLVATGERQKFSPYPADYFVRLWRILAPRGYVKLFIADYDHQAVCARITVAFGNTVIRKFSAWSGRHGRLWPNEVLEWGVIEWAKAHGFSYYDLEGIEPEAARAILRRQPLPEALRQTVTSFKLGFGGQVTLFPQAYDYVYNPVLRRAYHALGPMLSRAALEKALNRLRTR